MKFRGVKAGVSIALVGILAGGGGAYAAGQITGAQIKDGTITTKDIKKGTISATNLSAAAKKGLTGPAGPAGATGPAGPAGPAGESSPGVFGSAGAAGAKGDTGAQGPQGLQGLQGLQGVKGETGAPGAPGAKGDTGAAGAPGAKGDTGAAGAPGAKGDTGAAGAPGAKGDTGSAGAKGDKGDTGAAGPTGPAGPAGGPAGPKGDKGDPGPAGGNNITRVIGDPVPNGTSNDEWLAAAVATCPDGQEPVGGAFIQNVASLGEVYYNAPDYEDETSWLVLGANWADPEDPKLADGELQAIAYCAPSPTASKAPYAQRHAAALKSARVVAAGFHKQRRR